MLKLAGIMMLMFGCVGLGINKVSEEKQRIAELREIRNIIMRIQSEMAYGKRTLPEICLILKESAAAPYDSAFLKIFDRIEENDGRDIGSIWKECFTLCMEDMPLDKEEKNILINLTDRVGMMDEAIQADNIGQYPDMITEHIVQAESEYKNKSKVIISVSIMAGLFLTIWLL